MIMSKNRTQVTEIYNETAEKNIYWTWGQRSRKIEIKNEEYKAKDKEVKRKARTDKRKNVEGVAFNAVNAAKSNHFSGVYQLTKQLCGKKRSKTSGIRSKDG